ncbi:MAG: S-methyl-5-thioribose-1-phosphate isomerase [Actinomycetota bacterium]|nr:S-methyl-5-thioribose-1-phosphate isomerase [Actinomycetota bacterium]
MDAETDTAAVVTMRWTGDAVELLDQRLLPEQVVYVRCASAAAVADAIRDMVVRGAPAIGVAAAFGVAVEALRVQGRPDAGVAMEEAFARLAASRPTAVNLFWAIDRMRAGYDPQDPRRATEAMVAEALAIMEQDVAANRAMGAHGAALLPDGARVLTHCNAGALATAGWGTALGVIRSAVAQGKAISVIVDETRPYLQGARLTAWELVREGIPATLITDSMAGHLMATGEVDAVIVGADRIAANGDTANKIGTYMVAVLAGHHGIPFYVAAPWSTVDLALPDGSAIPIEERSAEEVTGFRDQHWAAGGVAVRNPAFDVTPAALVTALITERGVVHAPDTAQIAALID